MTIHYCTLYIFGTFETVTEVQNSNMCLTEIHKHKPSEKGNYIISKIVKNLNPIMLNFEQMSTILYPLVQIRALLLLTDSQRSINILYYLYFIVAQHSYTLEDTLIPQLSTFPDQNDETINSTPKSLTKSI